MRCVFWNSALWTPFETLRRVNMRKPEGIFILNEGPRLIYGDASCLVAWHVRDLRIDRDKSGNVVMEWTAPSGVHFDNDNETFHSLGKPRRRKFVWTEG